LRAKQNKYAHSELFSFLTPTGRSRLATDGPRHSLADLPFLHIRGSQRCFTLMQRDARLGSKVKPVDEWTTY
jgi:hypothetical protein